LKNEPKTNLKSVPFYVQICATNAQKGYSVTHILRLSDIGAGDGDFVTSLQPVGPGAIFKRLF